LRVPEAIFLKYLKQEEEIRIAEGIPGGAAWHHI
jgi:hypothetical protein